jgi:hypothetical protein
MDLLVNDISHVIQLAVAPVFLLAAISQALNVLSTRLGRIIDRGRRLNELQDAMPTSVAITADSGQEVDEEQYLLARRARLIHRAIKLCTMSALFVTLVIVCLFVDVLLELPLDQFIAFLFGVALLCLITAFVTFLREIELGTNAFRFGPYNITDRRHRRPRDSA